MISTSTPRGFIQLAAEHRSGRLLGAQVLAPGGGEIIQTAGSPSATV